MAADTDPIERGQRAPSFDLPGTDERNWTFNQVAGAKGTVVMFICNHCPYVTAVVDRIVRDANELSALGVKSVAISANDAATYPEDSFDNMKLFARRHGFSFPYLYDESQTIARAYGAVCTPEFFGFDAEGRLQYHGRLDGSGRNAAAQNLKRELFDAMQQIARTGKGPDQQQPSIGCAIKWKMVD